MTYFEYLLGKTPEGAKRAYGVLYTAGNDEEVLKIFDDFDDAKNYCDDACRDEGRKDGVFTVEVNDYFENDGKIEKAKRMTVIKYGRKFDDGK